MPNRGNAQATRRASPNPDPATRSTGWHTGPTAMAKRSAALKQIADAGAPLYQSLNDARRPASRCSAACCGRITAAWPCNEGSDGWRRVSGFGRDGQAAAHGLADIIGSGNAGQTMTSGGRMHRMMDS